MKNLKFSTQKLALLLVMLMFTIIPNMKVYSSVGNYATSSKNLNANQSYVLQQNDGAELQASRLGLAVAAVAAAIVAANDAGTVIGTVAHHVFDALGGHEIIIKDIAMATEQHDRLDFSDFDN